MLKGPVAVMLHCYLTLGKTIRTNYSTVVSFTKGSTIQVYLTRKRSFSLELIRRFSKTQTLSILACSTLPSQHRMNKSSWFTDFRILSSPVWKEIWGWNRESSWTSFAIIERSFMTQFIWNSSTKRKRRISLTLPSCTRSWTIKWEINIMTT